MKSKVQEIGTGQGRKDKEKQSSPALNPATNDQENSKVLDGELLPKSSTQTQRKKSMSSLENEPDSGSEIILDKKPTRKSKMPVPKLPSLEKRASQALKRLKVDPEELESAPQITPLLKNAEGGLKSVLGAMRFASQDEVISAFLEKYDSIPIGDRDRIPWEAIAIAAGVNLNHLLGSITLALASHSANVSRIIAVTNHPKITKARVNFGLKAGGERDRTQLDIMVGALPSAKGPTFIGKAVFGSPTQSAKDADDDDAPTIDAPSSDGFDDLFPSPNETQNKLVPIRQRLLES